MKFVKVCIETYHQKGRGIAELLCRGKRLDEIPTDAAALEAACVAACLRLRKRVNRSGIMGLQQRLFVHMAQRGGVPGAAFELLIGFGSHLVLTHEDGVTPVWASFSSPVLDSLRGWQLGLARGAGAGAAAASTAVDAEKELPPPLAGPPGREEEFSDRQDLPPSPDRLVFGTGSSIYSAAGLPTEMSWCVSERAAAGCAADGSSARGSGPTVTLLSASSLAGLLSAAHLPALF